MHNTYFFLLLLFIFYLFHSFNNASSHVIICYDFKGTMHPLLPLSTFTVSTFRFTKIIICSGIIFYDWHVFLWKTLLQHLFSWCCCYGFSLRCGLTPPPAENKYWYCDFTCSRKRENKMPVMLTLIIYLYILSTSKN